MVGIKYIKKWEYLTVAILGRGIWYKAEILIGNLGFTVIETFRDKRGPKKLWPVDVV